MLNTHHSVRYCHPRWPLGIVVEKPDWLGTDDEMTPRYYHSKWQEFQV